MQHIPHYTVRYSRKAKMGGLRISIEHGLEVILPYSMEQKNARRIVENHAKWIEKHSHLFEQHEAFQRAREVIPSTVTLLATDQTFYIKQCNLKNARLTAVDNTLYLPEKSDAALRSLRKWFLGHAKVHFLSVLTRVCEDTGMRYSGLRVGLQKTRWGSCSYTGNIALNARLMCLEPELVRHVVLHELCHMQQRNHGKNFYTLLAKHDPEYLRHARELRRSGERLPLWVRMM